MIFNTKSKSKEEEIREYDEREEIIDQYLEFHGTSKEPDMAASELLGTMFKHLMFPNPHIEDPEPDAEIENLIREKKRQEMGMKDLESEYPEAVSGFRILDKKEKAKIETLADLAKAIDVKEVSLSDEYLTVVKKGEKHNKKYPITDSLFGGSSKWMLIEVEDDSKKSDDDDDVITKDVFICMDDIDLVIKALKGKKKIKLSEAEKNISKHRLFKDHGAEIYRVFDFSNTEILDDFSSENLEKFAKILYNGIICNAKDKADGFIERIPRMRFTKLEAWDNFVVESDKGCISPNHYNTNKYTLKGTKYVVSTNDKGVSTIQYYWKDKAGDEINIKKNEITLDVPMTVDGKPEKGKTVKNKEKILPEE